MYAALEACTVNACKQNACAQFAGTRHYCALSAGTYIAECFDCMQSFLSYLIACTELFDKVCLELLHQISNFK